ncbi:MAG: TaqI-like C-terminal specificity domain-containing protein [Candidatus Pacebacteria bacterium]|nr:TaqI-like C-terminal specificity domain-containing protein [Candidatus Paceibacterota bacterium]
MEEIFKIYNSIYSSYKNNGNLLKKLFSFFTAKPVIENSTDDFLYKSLKTGKTVDPLKIFQLVGLIHQKKQGSEKIINTDKRKHFGIYYTDYSIARLITKESLNDLSVNQILNLNVLEPCAGTGVFIIAYIDEVLQKLGTFNSIIIQRIINKIYFSDIDDEAINILIKVLPLYIKSRYGSTIGIPPRNYYKGDILFKNEGDKIVKIDPKIIFKVSNGFDVVLTNPPYKLLKANGNKYKDDLNKNKYAIDIKKLISFIKEKSIYKFNQGTLNYYKIFLEEILENYTHSSSRIGVIIPITLLNDKQSELLRKRIINKYKLFKLYIIPEKNKFFPDISQAFCFFALDKTIPGNIIRINPRVISSHDFDNNGVEVKIEHIEKISITAPIVIENEIGWQILKKLNALPKLGTLNSIYNARGELDLTLDRNFITKEKTSLPLLRGNNVNEFSYTTSNYYTDEKFVSKLNGKQKYILKERIVCQQISNIHLEKRLKFTKIPGNIILGNSCNFLTFNGSLLGNQVSLDYLLGILNSLLLNWRFKVTNSNNHVSNYELAELPIVIPSASQKKEIEKLVYAIKEKKDRNKIYELNMEVFKLYGLNDEEIDYVLDKHEKAKEFFLTLRDKELFYAYDTI